MLGRLDKVLALKFVLKSVNQDTEFKMVLGQTIKMFGHNKTKQTHSQNHPTAQAVLLLMYFYEGDQPIQIVPVWANCMWVAWVGSLGTVGSDVTLRENWSVFIRCRTMPVGAVLAL